MRGKQVNEHNRAVTLLVVQAELTKEVASRSQVAWTLLFIKTLFWQ